MMHQRRTHAPGFLQVLLVAIGGFWLPSAARASAAEVATASALQRQEIELTFTAGNVVSAEDYGRYCLYLVARYGARPAIWLLGGDGPATAPAVVEQLDRAGQTIETWDAYRQPTGIHYAPHSLFRTHQDRVWLDFQWCQTGHNGEHLAERVGVFAAAAP